MAGIIFQKEVQIEQKVVPWDTYVSKYNWSVKPMWVLFSNISLAFQCFLNDFFHVRYLKSVLYRVLPFFLDFSFNLFYLFIYRNRFWKWKFHHNKKYWKHIEKVKKCEMRLLTSDIICTNNNLEIFKCKLQIWMCTLLCFNVSLPVSLGY